MSALSKILVIDDDRDFAAAVQTLLESSGYEVIRAASGREGLALISSADPDVVICDIMMESSTEGYSVSGAVKFREQSGASELPFIMVSSIAASPDELFPRSEELGMIRPDYYLTKPLDIPRFLEIVKQAAARRARV
jgi:two-component system response regulator MprA